MRWKHYGIILIAIIIAGVMLTLAARQQDGIRADRDKMGLSLKTDLGDAPPSLAFATVAMGAFRGLIVDILWMRADDLKQKGQFFDAKQLADWITLLQPRFPQVWDFQSWNMAYNISVAIPNTQPAERWRWVRNGYELLRDKAIPLNPQSIVLYRQLSWIFLHKIGEISDDCHSYYKTELALSMQQLLGDLTNVNFEKLAAAPLTLDAMLADAEVAKFIDELKKADPAFAQTDKLIENFLSLRQTPDRFSKEALQTLELNRENPALEKFDAFARAYQIRHVWKMDIAYMQKLNGMYGPMRFEDPNQRDPLNWEHPAAHAIYWSARGLEFAGKTETYRVDEKNTDRIIFHSLQMLYRSGKTVIYTSRDGKKDLFLRPDLRMFASCDQTWKKVIEKYEILEEGNPKAVRGGHKNFLENAVMTFYQSGHLKQALEIYKELITLYPKDEQGYEIANYKLPMIEFLKKGMKEEFQGLGIRDAVELINGMLKESYFRYAIHDDNESAAREKMATEVFTFYQKEHSDEMYRVGMPSLELLRYTAFMDFLNDPLYPEEMRLGMLGRMQVERPDLFEKIQKQEQLFFEELRKEQESQQNAEQPGEAAQ
jgi:tetratricopeptide (TPR) repeat protein